MRFYEGILLAQFMVTSLSSGFNAAYFWGYGSPHRRRRVGAKVMATVSLATLVESLYFGLFVFFSGWEWSNTFFLDPSRWLVARLLVCLSSLLITGLILRQKWNRR